MKKILPLIALLVATACHAGGFANTTTLSAGANGIWLNGDLSSKPDVEGAANGAISLSPHISGVGSVNYGFINRYWRSTAGVRITATDVNDRNFSIGLGAQYHTNSLAVFGPNEWCPEAAIGLRPFPASVPDFALTGLGWYGLTSKRAGVDVGIRYSFSL